MPGSRAGLGFFQAAGPVVASFFLKAQLVKNLNISEPRLSLTPSRDRVRDRNGGVCGPGSGGACSVRVIVPSGRPLQTIPAAEAGCGSEA